MPQGVRAYFQTHFAVLGKEDRAELLGLVAKAARLDHACAGQWRNAKMLLENTQQRHVALQTRALAGEILDAPQVILYRDCLREARAALVRACRHTWQFADAAARSQIDRLQEEA